MELTGNVQGLIDLVGGGSDVEVTPIIQSGTKIATIEVDDVSYDLYAPDAPVQGVEVDGVSVVNEHGVAEITLPDAPVQGVEVDGVSVVNEHGVAEITLPDAGVNYSTNEQVIGTWIDGKPLYQKTVNCGTLPDNTSKNIAHGVANIDYIVNIFGFMSNGTVYNPLPFANRNNALYQAQLQADGTNIVLATGGNIWSTYNAWVTMQYTKTTDIV